MDEKQVTIVLAVAKYMSFGEGALETSYSASTVSKQVMALEHELGITIFERKARSQVSLTPAGEILIPSFRLLADDIFRIRNQARNILNDEESRLSIGCPDAFSTLGEDELLAEFESIFPDIHVNQITSSKGNSDLLIHVATGSIDASFGVHITGSEIPTQTYPEIGILYMDEISLKFAIPSHYPLLPDGTVSLRSLKNETFLFHSFSDNKDTNPGIRKFTEACKSAGFNPKIQFPKMRRSAIYPMVASGKGILPLMYEPSFYYPGISIVPCKENYYTFTRVLYYNKKHISPCLKNFLSFIQDRLHKNARK